ncbi:hypothetical protein QZH41_013707, partial [Actinostola sp. cb2023]
MANCFSWLKRRNEPIKKVTLLMVGLDNAGKTSTVADLNGDTLEGITPTVGFLSSSFSLYRYNVTIYDLGGGSKIRAIWKNYFTEVYGIVFVVDASDRHRLEECRDVLHDSMNSDKICGKPILILANKQDITGAMNEEEVYQQLDLGSFTARNKCPCQVFSCTAVLNQGNKIDRQIKKGFQWLLQEISQNFVTLSQRVEREYAEQKRIATEERKKKIARVKKEQEAREKAQKEAAEQAAKQEQESDDDVVVAKDYPQDDYAQAENTEKILDNQIHARGRLAPLEPSSTDSEIKKKKKKKRKRKNNKTVPIDEDIELSQQNSSAVAWGDSAADTSTMNGFASRLSGTSPRRLEPLALPMISDSRAGASTDQENVE